MTTRQLPGMVWTTDRELRILHVTGWSVEDLSTGPVVGMSLYDFLGTNDPTEPAIANHLAALAGRRQSFQYRFANRWFAAFIGPLKDERGQVTGCLGAAFEVTNQRSIEQRLVRGEARLAEAQRVAHVGSFEWDMAANVVTWSDELHRIHGIEPGEFDGTYEAFLERVHPDDRDYTTSVLFEACRKLGEFEYEHRVIRPDRGVRILHTRGLVIADEHGKASRMVGSCWDTTELKSAIDGVERARSLLEATIEATADGILVVDRDGVIRAKNSRFLTLWRIPSDVAEQTDRALLAYVIEQLEDPDGFIRGVRELYDRPESESFDVLRFKDGRVFERYSTPQRLGSQIVGRVWSFRDVTERERLLGRALFLADAGRLLASLDVEPALASLAQLAVPYLGDGCAIDLLCNGAPRRLPVASRSSAQAFDPELHGRVLAGHPTIYSVGSRSHMAVPLVAKGEIVGAVTFVAAPSRTYAARELELAEELASRAALSVQNARLFESRERALCARDEFLSIAAHEIRGPITSMHMAVQSLLKNKLPSSATPKLLEIIARDDRRIARLMEDLLTLGTVGAGHMHLNLEDVDLADVARRVAARLGSELARSGSSLSITSQGHAVGQWDRYRLDQVVSNLLSNAIKFGMGRPIAISVRGEPRLATLAVSDRGIGIAPELLERIFQPFERGVSVRHHGGFGLGLFIVRTIVSGLGGSVRMESELNVGSTCIVELPIQRPA